MGRTDIYPGEEHCDALDELGGQRGADSRTRHLESIATE
jgi:hypothetical protein